MAGPGVKIADAYVEIHGEVDETSIKKSAKAAAAEQEKAFKKFEADLAKRRQMIRKSRMEELQEQGTKSVFDADAFGDLGSSFGGWKLLRPFIVPLAAAFATLGAAAVSAASSIGLSSLAMAGAIPAAAGLIGIGGTLYLLFQKLKDGAMAPFTDQLKAMKDRLADVALEAARPGLELFFKAILSFGPLAQNYIRSIAQGIGWMAAQFAQLAASPIFRARLELLLMHAATGARLLLAAVTPLTNVIVILGAAAGPIFTRFAQWIYNVVTAWEKWLSLKSETGDLQRILKEAADEASKWGQILWNFGSGFVGILVGAKSNGQAFAQTLLDISEAFKAWAWDPETHGKIKELLEKIFALDVSQMFQLAAGIAAVGYAFKTITGLASGVSFISTLLQLGPVGWVLLAVAAALTAVTAALLLAWTASETFRAKIGEVWAWIQAVVLPILQEWTSRLVDKLFPALDKAVQEQLPKFQEAIARVSAFVAANREELRMLFDGIVRLVGFIIDPGIPIFARFAGVSVAVLSIAFTNLMRVILFLHGVLNTTIGIMQMVAASFSMAASWIMGAWMGLANWFSGALHSMGNAAQSVFNAIQNAASNALRWVQEKVAGIAKEIASLPGRLAGGLRGLIPGFAHGGIAGAATGGPRSGFHIVGEHGPELAKLPAGSRVRSNSDTRRLLEQGSGGQSQSGSTTVEFLGNTSDAFASAFMLLVRQGKIQITARA